MIVEKIMETKYLDIKQYPVHSNRASELGHPCVRYHVYNRTRWEEKSMHDARLQLIFDLGREIEDITIRDMKDAGFEIVEQQRPFSWREYNITGTVDGKVLLGGEAIPFEVKSCSPYMFDKINSIEDLTKGKYLYLRKYPTQLNLYMLMDNKERGLFIFKNKQTGAYKEIWMQLDYELGEQTIRKAEEINKHVADGTLPAHYDDESVCNDCGYRHICLPEHIGKEVEIDTSELSEMLDRLEELKEAKLEYEKINEEIKEMVEGREKVLAGDWYVSGKWIDKKEFVVKANRYWQIKKMRISS